MEYVTLKQSLDEEIAQRGLPTQLRDLLLGVSETCKEISYEVSRGALAGVLGMAGTRTYRERIKRSSMSSATTLWSRVALQPVTCGMASEEMDHVLRVPEDQPVGPYLICFDPLDGSSNIDINVSIGTIFSVLPSPRGACRDICDEELPYSPAATSLLLAMSCTVLRLRWSLRSVVALSCLRLTRIAMNTSLPRLLP